MSRADLRNCRVRTPGVEALIARCAAPVPRGNTDGNRDGIGGRGAEDSWRLAQREWREQAGLYLGRASAAQGQGQGRRAALGKALCRVHLDYYALQAACTWM